LKHGLRDFAARSDGFSDGVGGLLVSWGIGEIYAFCDCDLVVLVYMHARLVSGWTVVGFFDFLVSHTITIDHYKQPPCHCSQVLVSDTSCSESISAIDEAP
jgi:hypothetical protein